jgi:hypothetical protein
MHTQWHDTRDDVSETLDRLLDKGIVVDPWARAGIGAIELVTQATRIVVASVEIHQDTRC